MQSTYRVRARNTSADSENKIHDNAVASTFGFRGGLVPGVTIYAYMTVPLVERFDLDWLERGSMMVKFHQPFYDGEEVVVKAEIDKTAEPTKVALTAAREDGIVCATALATVNDSSMWMGEPRFGTNWNDSGLPLAEDRLIPSPELFSKGKRLGALTETLRAPDPSILALLDDTLPIYTEANAPVHPFTLLGFANQILVQNYRLGPWIHASSDLKNWGSGHDGDEVSVRGEIADCFERKGHEFVVLDLELATRDRLLQQVRHTAIYRPRVK